MKCWSSKLGIRISLVCPLPPLSAGDSAVHQVTVKGFLLFALSLIGVAATIRHFLAERP